jgi:hypothetical protein
MRAEFPGQLDLLDLLAHVVEVVEIVHTYQVEIRPGVYEKRSLSWVRWMCSCGASAHEGTLWSDPDMARAQGERHVG